MLHRARFIKVFLGLLRRAFAVIKIALQIIFLLPSQLMPMLLNDVTRNEREEVKSFLCPGVLFQCVGHLVISFLYVIIVHHQRGVVMHT